MDADVIWQYVVRIHVKTVLHIWFEGFTNKLWFVSFCLSVFTVFKQSIW